MLFHKNKPKPNPAKKVVYLIASTILGLLFSFIIHALVEIEYLAYAAREGKEVVWYYRCALHPAIQIGLLVAGAVGGFFLGQWWWKLVYVKGLKRFKKK